VDWTDSRKYITFATPEGKKCRNRKLYPPEQFTKEALLNAFELNQQKTDEKLARTKMEMLLSAIQHIKTDDLFEGGAKHPLTALEGEALKEEMAELKKGKGFNWDKENENSL
jgi:hypothetical protein